MGLWDSRSVGRRICAWDLACSTRAPLRTSRCLSTYIFLARPARKMGSFPP